VSWASFKTGEVEMFIGKKYLEVPEIPSFDDNHFFRSVSFDSDSAIYLVNVGCLNDGYNNVRSFFFINPGDLHDLISELNDGFSVVSVYLITCSHVNDVVSWSMESVKAFGLCFKECPFPSISYFQKMEDDSFRFDKDGIDTTEVTEYKLLFSELS